MKRLMVALWLVWFVVLGLAAQQVATATAASGEQVEVSVGTFLFAAGEKLALEIVREDPCPCLCQPIEVVGFQVLDAEGGVVYQESDAAYPRPLGEWIGRWDLTDAAGAPVPAGDYTCLVLTSVGSFRAALRVLAAGELPGLGRSLASASVCGLSLRVYRLVEEAEEGSLVSLQQGEFLMVALPGNPTTGFQWEPREVPEFLALLEGVGYLAAGEPGLVGAGGTFYFRFSAEEPGEGQLSFAYRRPWEEGPAAETFTITVSVR